MSEWKPATAEQRALIEGEIRDLAQNHAKVVSHDVRRWASITFTGSAHRLELSFSGHDGVGGGELFVAALPEHEFAFPGYICADAYVQSIEHTLKPAALKATIELLLLSETQEASNV